MTLATPDDGDTGHGGPKATSMEKIWFWRPERTGKDEANESVSLRGRSTMLSYGYPRPLS